MQKKIKFHHQQGNKIISQKEITAIIKENQIIYKDEVLTKIKFQDESLIFTRQTKEYDFQLIISTINSCTYTLKTHNLTYDIKVQKASFKRISNSLEIYYEIETLENGTYIKLKNI